MANTYVDYTATASQTDFAFSFPYLEDAHVVVEIDGVASTAFSIVTSPSTKVVLNAGATVGQKVRVRRDSNASIAFVDFVNGSVLTEKNLDDSYLHNLYLNEEIGELNEASLQTEVGGTNWDAKSLKIVNVADPVSAQDVSTKAYTDTKVSKTGDTMSGDIAMASNKVTGLSDPTNVQDASTKNYTDTQIANAVSGSTTASSKTTFTGAGSATFTFSSGINLDGDTMYEVAIDGVLQEPTVAYAIDADANTITFTSTPPTGSNIVVVQRGYAVPVTSTPVSTALIQDNAVTDAKLNSAKLNGIATGATANDTDANLKNRANHTGTQLASTISDFDTEVSNNSSVTANTAKVGLTADSVTADKISSTDTTFNVNDSNSNIGTGALADSAFQLTVDGGSGKDTIYAKGNQSAYVDLKLENENASGNGARFRAVKGDFTATLQVQPTYKRASMVIEDNSGSSLESVGVYVTNETGLSQGSFIPLGSMLSGTNSNINLGGTNNTWDNAYINAVYTGSDRNLKQDIEDLNEAELRVATALKGMMKKFRLKDAVVKKGDDARIHVGVIAQDIKAAFEAEGLDAYRYALIGEDTWWSKQDENGEWLVEKTETEGFTKHTKMSVRYEQLLAFIISAL